MDIEKTRAQQNEELRLKEAGILAFKHAATRVGESAVAYDLLTNGVRADGPPGAQLLASDAQAQYRMNVRGASLYLARNSFNPITGTDIPGRLAAGEAAPTGTPAKLLAQLQGNAARAGAKGPVCVDVAAKSAWNRTF